MLSPFSSFSAPLPFGVICTVKLPPAWAGAVAVTTGAIPISAASAAAFQNFVVILALQFVLGQQQAPGAEIPSA
jgi:hypothetical protein